MISNLRNLTEKTEMLYFKTDSVKHEILLMKRDCLFASIDLKDAYYSVKKMHLSSENTSDFCFVDRFLSLFASFKVFVIPLGFSQN